MLDFQNKGTIIQGNLRD